MFPKLLNNLSGEELMKEYIRFGLSGRFTMKEAIVELAISLFRNHLDFKYVFTSTIVFECASVQQEPASSS